MHRTRLHWTRNVMGLAVLGVGMLTAESAFGQRWISGIPWKEPTMVKPGEPGGPPSDAIVLFDGKNLDAWEGGDQWELRDGYALARNRTIETKQNFGDVQLHLEFASPGEVKGSGQGRGNSGVFLAGRYEVQILDSWENETYYEGQAASVYNQAPPLVNASRPPGEWQALDIVFTAPRFHDDGSLKSPAYMTVLHNGVLVQNHWEVQGVTHFNRPPNYQAHGDGPIRLQHHGDPVQFRNIWVREVRRTPAVEEPQEEETPDEPEAQPEKPQVEGEEAKPEEN